MKDFNFTNFSINTLFIFYDPVWDSRIHLLPESPPDIYDSDSNFFVLHDIDVLKSIDQLLYFSLRSFIWDASAFFFVIGYKLCISVSRKNLFFTLYPITWLMILTVLKIVTLIIVLLFIV